MTHAQWIQAWHTIQRLDPHDGAYWRAGPHKEYLRWYHGSTRTKLKPAWTTQPIEDLPSDDDDDIVDDYDLMTRHGTQPERAPLQDYMVS